MFELAVQIFGIVHGVGQSKQKSDRWQKTETLLAFNARIYPLYVRVYTRGGVKCNIEKLTCHVRRMNLCHMSHFIDMSLPHHE